MPQIDFFPEIINKLLEGVILLDRNKNVVFWNEWIGETSGISARNAVGKNFITLFPDIEFTRIDSSIDQVIQFGQSSFISHIINPIMLPLYHFKKGTEKTRIFHNIRITSIPSAESGNHVMIHITDETVTVLKEQLLRSRALEEKVLNERLLKEIEERRLVEDKLLLSASVIANTREGVVITDDKGIIASVNPAFVEITGYRPEDAVGRHIRILKSGKHDDNFYKSLWQELLNTGHWKGEFVNRKPDNSLIIVESSITAIQTPNDQASHFVSIFHDVTQRKKYEEMLEVRSRTDSLTGLLNRRAFNEALSNQWRICVRHGFFIGIIMIDVDFFKKYNDTYGHQAGDDCLIRIASVLRANIRRADDVIARYGGEEFVIVLTQTELGSLKTLAAAILKDVKDMKMPHAGSSISDYVTITAGISAIIPTMGDTIEKLIEAADQALYRAKEAGRDQIAVETGSKGSQNLTF